jgi:Tfp pilus assembly protein PilF
VRYSPHYVQAYLNRATLYLSRGEFAAAVADYDRVVANLPNEYVGHGARCWALALWGADLPAARAACEGAAQFSPGNPATHNSLGLIGLREGRYEAAWADYDAAVQVSGARPRHLYGRGVAALRLGREPEGRADLAAATAEDPNMPETYATYGVTP